MATVAVTQDQIHKIDDYIFVLPFGSKIFTVYYKQIDKEHIADRYISCSAKETRKAFEAVKKFTPIPLPKDIKTYCDCTDKPCDPDSWFCHRQFAAIRFIKDHPGSHSSNKDCHQLRTRGVAWIEALRRKTSEIDGKQPMKLDHDITIRAIVKECSRQQAYAEYAQVLEDGQ